MPSPPCSPPSLSGGWRLPLLLICCCSWWVATDLDGSGGGGSNKLSSWRHRPRVYLVAALCFPSLAGRGGEEGREIGVLLTGSGGCGVPSELMHWRGISRSPAREAPSCPWWMMTKWISKAEPQIKRRRCLLPAGFPAFPPLSAGQGGEGEDGRRETAADVRRRWSWEAARSSTTSAATSGRPISKPVMISGVSTSCVRPLSRTAPALNVREEASGFVPASTHGGGVAGLWLVGGEREGSDCFEKKFSGVFSALARDLCVICFFMGSFVTICSSTALF
jgi:hypothetical protein